MPPPGASSLRTPAPWDSDVGPRVDPRGAPYYPDPTCKGDTTPRGPAPRVPGREPPNGYASSGGSWFTPVEFVGAAVGAVVGAADGAASAAVGAAVELVATLSARSSEPTQEPLSSELPLAPLSEL